MVLLAAGPGIRDTQVLFFLLFFYVYYLFFQFENSKHDSTFCKVDQILIEGT